MSFFRSGPVPSSLDEVLEQVDLYAEVPQPLQGSVHRRLLAPELADDPAHVLLDVGPTDVGQHVELPHQPGDDRLADAYAAILGILEEFEVPATFAFVSPRTESP